MPLLFLQVKYQLLWLVPMVPAVLFCLLPEIGICACHREGDCDKLKAFCVILFPFCYEKSIFTFLMYIINVKYIAFW